MANFMSKQKSTYSTKNLDMKFYAIISDKIVWRSPPKA